jgi:hypothetical protein
VHFVFLCVVGGVGRNIAENMIRISKAIGEYNQVYLVSPLGNDWISKKLIEKNEIIGMNLSYSFYNPIFNQQDVFF